MSTPIRARRDEEKEKRRKSILDAAEKVIARRGLEKAHFGEIAQRTRLSRSLVYVYFPTKDDLFHAVCERGLNNLQARFEAAAGTHAKGIDQVMAMGRAYFAFSREEPLYFEMMTELQAREDANQPASPAEESAERHGQKCLVLVAEALARGLQDKSVHPGIGDPGATALSIWAFTHGLIQISSKKAVMLESKFKLTQQDMIEHGFALLHGSLASGKATAGSVRATP
ncbi:MAG: TetR/AcrR family transcriptional regulator [Opitutaceae bacterium]